MTVLTSKVARIIFAIPFALFGLNHLMMAGKMVGMVPSFIPGGILWVYIIGLLLIAGAVSIFLRKFDYIGALVLAGLLAIFILTIHLPGLFKPETQQMSMIMFFKDLGLLGGALLVAGISKEG